MMEVDIVYVKIRPVRLSVGRKMTTTTQNQRRASLPLMLLAVSLAVACPSTSAPSDDGERDFGGPLASVSTCGDGVREGHEVCEDNDLNGKTCQDFGFDRGDLGCAFNCLDFDPSTCGCVTAGCDPGFYCDTASKQCEEGCDDSSEDCQPGEFCDDDKNCQPGCDDDEEDCQAGESCDLDTNQCVCADGFHDCDGVCRADDDPNYCGAACASCPTDAHGDAICVDGSCDLSCDAQYEKCDDRCQAWPSGAENVQCVGDDVVPTDCQGGHLICSETCALCPSAGVSTTTCQGSQCVASSCTNGYELCDSTCSLCPTAGVDDTTCSGDQCVAESCQAGFELCGGACATCPTANVETVGCDGSQCVATACEAGYAACDGECALCPTGDGVSSTTCEADACVIAECEEGFYICDDGCCSVDEVSELVFDNQYYDNPHAHIELNSDDEVFIVYNVSRNNVSYDRWMEYYWKLDEDTYWHNREISGGGSHHFSAMAIGYYNQPVIFYSTEQESDYDEYVATWTSSSSGNPSSGYEDEICGWACSISSVTVGDIPASGSANFFVTARWAGSWGAADSGYYRLGQMGWELSLSDDFVDLADVDVLPDDKAPRGALSLDETPYLFWSDSDTGEQFIAVLETAQWEVYQVDWGDVSTYSMADPLPLAGGFETYGTNTDGELFHLVFVDNALEVTQVDIDDEVAVFAFRRRPDGRAVLGVSVRGSSSWSFQSSAIIGEVAVDGPWRKLANFEYISIDLDVDSQGLIHVAYGDPETAPRDGRYAVLEGGL